ncbi:MAG: hypothetical protein SGARI_005115 [Bacillariaceae sp.]
MPIDPDYPGTAVERLMAVRSRVATLTQDDLNADWSNVRRKLLWAGGLKDLTEAIPGQGYTGHAWSTCANGSNQEPPQDVAHVQFRSRIAFKLVWCPTETFDTFVLVDDDGKELARGTPTGELPWLRQRQMNFQIVKESKYSKAADEIAASLSSAAKE